MTILPTDIVSRFCSEQETIQKFVIFLQRKLVVYKNDISRLCQVLARYGFIDNEWSARNLDQREPLSYDLFQRLRGDIAAARPDIQHTLREAPAELAELGIPALLSETYQISQFDSDLIHYFLDYLLINDESEEHREFAVEFALEELEADHDRLSLDELREIVNRIAEALPYLLAERKLSDLNEVAEVIDEMEMIARTSEQDAEINTLRQSFILLMTAFDAAVFDLVTLALEKDFFHQIGCFAEKEKLALDKLFDYSGFDELRDAVIEKQLKSKYLKDLLWILNAKDVSLVAVSTGDEFISLVELVQRRNLHIHNRGYVDARYLEKDENGTPRYNIYNLAEGTLAPIDKPYLEKANRLCQNCVKRVAVWVDSLQGESGN